MFIRILLMFCEKRCSFYSYKSLVWNGPKKRYVLQTLKRNEQKNYIALTEMLHNDDNGVIFEPMYFAKGYGLNPRNNFQSLLLYFLYHVMWCKICIYLKGLYGDGNQLIDLRFFYVRYSSSILVLESFTF